MIAETLRAIFRAVFNAGLDISALAPLFVTLVGGAGISSGTTYTGVVTAQPVVGQFTIDSLKGLGDTKFVNWEAYVFRSHLGAGGAPQNEHQIVSSYTSLTGNFTAPAFTVPVDVGDEIILINPDIAAGVPLANSVLNQSAAQVIGNKADAAVAVPGVVASVIAYIKGCLNQFAAILANFAVPAPNSADNILSRDVAGNKTDAATLDDMSALATASLVAELKRVLLRMSPNAFTATIQGAAATELDTMLGQLATYFAAAGAAYSSTVNPGGAARNNVEQVLEDLADMIAGGPGVITYPAAASPGNGVSLAEVVRAIINSMVGGDTYTGYTNINNSANTSLNAIAQKFAVLLAADGANTFNPTINGAARTDLELALNNFALYFAAAGAALSVTMNPGAGARANLQLILQDLGDMLAGATGIVTFPAGVAAANNVSLAEVIRYIQETCLGYEGATALANKLTAVRAGYLDTLNTGVLVGSYTAAVNRLAAVNQIFSKAITSAANAGAVVAATITTQACMLKSIVVRSNAATTADLTNITIKGGAGLVITFIDAVSGVRANIAAADQQVAWQGAVALAAAKTITITLTGTGATAVDLTIIFEFEAIADGGYLA